MVKFFSEASVFSLSVDFLLSRISWLVLFISSPGSSCSSPGAIPWTGSSTCGQGVHWDGIRHRETAHWVEITLLIDEWPKMATHRVQGNTCLPTAVSHRSISLSHSLPFPLLIRVLSFHCTLLFFFSESQVFQMSQDTSMSEKPGVVVTDTSQSLKNPAPWEAVSISLSTRNCLPWPLLMVAASNAAHNPC